MALPRRAAKVLPTRLARPCLVAALLVLASAEAAIAAGKISYVVRDQVRGVNSDGSGDRFIARAEEADWSPDGKSLVVKVDGSDRVAVLRPGRSPRVVERRQAFSPLWSPSGGLISFGRTVTTSTPPPGRNCEPCHVTAWFAARPDGTGKRQLFASESPPVWWGPRRLVYTELERAARPGSTATIAVNAHEVGTGRTTRLFDQAATNSLSVLATSPDGRLFAARRDEPGLILVRPDGTVTKVLTRLDVRTADWSPDGRQLVLSISPSRGRTGLWLIRQDGSGLRRLVGGDRASNPSWGPGRLLRHGWR